MITCLFSVVLVVPAAAQGTAEPPTAELDLEDLTEVKIRVSTGHPKPISRAPAVASVITARQIEAMGASTLDEVLETVAGLHVVPSKVQGLDPNYSIRGVLSSTKSQTLILVNGVPVTDLLNGGQPRGFHLPSRP